MLFKMVTTTTVIGHWTFAVIEEYLRLSELIGLDWIGLDQLQHMHYTTNNKNNYLRPLYLLEQSFTVNMCLLIVIITSGL